MLEAIILWLRLFCVMKYAEIKLFIFHTVIILTDSRVIVIWSLPHMKMVGNWYSQRPFLYALQFWICNSCDNQQAVKYVAGFWFDWHETWKVGQSGEGRYFITRYLSNDAILIYWNLKIIRVTVFVFYFWCYKHAAIMQAKLLHKHTMIKQVVNCIFRWHSENIVQENGIIFVLFKILS